MSSPVHQVSYDYEPQRNLITEVRNRLLAAAPEAAGDLPLISSYRYPNDALGRRDQISVSGKSVSRFFLSWHVDMRVNAVQIIEPCACMKRWQLTPIVTPIGYAHWR